MRIAAHMKPPKLLYVLQGYTGIRGVAMYKHFTCIFLILTAQTLLGDSFKLGESSWSGGPHGLVAYVRSFDGGKELHLIRLGASEPRTLFIKRVPPVKPPICFTNAVVVVEVDGTITKFDLTGAQIFSAKPTGFTGACGLSGRISGASTYLIYLTETFVPAGGKGFSYRLHFVDVSGAKPFIKATFSIPELGKVVLTPDGDVLIVSSSKVVRVPVPGDEDGANPSK